MPTRRAPARPGPSVTAMASRSAKVTPASRDGGADDGDDGAEVLAGGELGDDAAVVGVDGDLRGDDVGEGFAAGADDGGGGLVAGAFDAEDQAGFGHVVCTPLPA